MVEGPLEPIAQALPPSLVASIELSPGTPRHDELYAAIPLRHTNGLRTTHAVVIPAKSFNRCSWWPKKAPL